MNQQNEENTGREGLDTDDEEEGTNKALGVIIPRKNKKRQSNNTGVWTISQQSAIDSYIKNVIYVRAPVMDTESFKDDTVYSKFASTLNMTVDEFSEEQKKSLISLTKYRLDQTQSRDRKMAFRNMSK